MQTLFLCYAPTHDVAPRLLLNYLMLLISALGFIRVSQMFTI